MYYARASESTFRHCRQPSPGPTHTGPTNLERSTRFGPRDWVPKFAGGYMFKVTYFVQCSIEEARLITSRNFHLEDAPSNTFRCRKL